nr:MAG TPA: hypothetical protein [Caudoviricetes sp.]
MIRISKTQFLNLDGVIFLTKLLQQALVKKMLKRLNGLLFLNL